MRRGIPDSVHPAWWLSGQSAFRLRAADVPHAQTAAIGADERRGDELRPDFGLSHRFLLHADAPMVGRWFPGVGGILPTAPAVSKSDRHRTLSSAAGIPTVEGGWICLSIRMFIPRLPVASGFPGNAGQ